MKKHEDGTEQVLMF